MKLCGRCQENKELTEFAIHEKKGQQAFCKECNRNYGRNHYRLNKQYYADRNTRRRNEWSKWWNEYKSTLSCVKCNESHVACLDFHHEDPAVKDGNLATIARSWGKERILKEVAKCIVICSNCHRKLHWEERQNVWN